MIYVFRCVSVFGGAKGVLLPPPLPHAARQAHGVTGKTSPVNQLLTIREKTVYMNWFIKELYSNLFLVSMTGDHNAFCIISPLHSLVLQVCARYRLACVNKALQADSRMCSFRMGWIPVYGRCPPHM